jgi:hypothetical protein
MKALPPIMTFERQGLVIGWAQKAGRKKKVGAGTLFVVLLSPAFVGGQYGTEERSSCTFQE